MKFLKYILLLAALLGDLYSAGTNNESIYILVENQTDRMIAEDIRKVTADTMNIEVYSANYKTIIDKVLTDPKAQFGIVPHDVLIYERDISKRESFENNIKMILPLYDRYIYILTRKDTNINSIDNLVNKRVNIELDTNAFSITGALIRKKHDIQWVESHYGFEEAVARLNKGELDALILVDTKRSARLRSIPPQEAERFKLISPELGSDFSEDYITSYDYPWITRDVPTSVIHEVLISYNYQPSKEVERFNYYVENISGLIYRVAKNMNLLQQQQNGLWKRIEPFYYTRVRWPLHSLAKKAILRYMDMQERFSNTFGMQFVTVPSGDFMMGTDNTALPADEHPQVQKHVDSFSVMTTEVTQREWRAVMGDEPSYHTLEKLGHNTLDHPVDSISYNDALQFINRLNTLEARGNYRLPTETEWEYASEHRNVPLDKYAWYHENSHNKTRTVASKEPNKFGLYDTLGNVWEWCSGYYSSNHEQNSTIEEFRLLKGGSFENLAVNIRATYRNKNKSGIKRPNNGLRLVYDRSSKGNKSFYYKVNEGDTLQSIALKYYQDATKWDLLYYANQASIGSDLSSLKPGQMLRVPNLKVNALEKRTFNVVSKLTPKGIKFLSGTEFIPFINPELPYGGMANHLVIEMFELLHDDDYKIFWESDFSKHFRLLEQGEYDVGVAWFKPDCTKHHESEETRKRCEFRFSKPFFDVLTNLYKRKDAPFTVTAISDIYGKKICRPRGIYTFDLEEQRLIDGQTVALVRPETQKECFDLLMGGGVDFVAMNKFSGDLLSKKMKIFDRVESVPAISKPLGLHFIVHSSNPRVKEILDKLNRAIDELKESGRLLEIRTDHLHEFYK